LAVERSAARRLHVHVTPPIAPDGMGAERSARVVRDADSLGWEREGGVGIGDARGAVCEGARALSAAGAHGWWTIAGEYT